MTIVDGNGFFWLLHFPHVKDRIPWYSIFGINKCMVKSLDWVFKRLIYTTVPTCFFAYPIPCSLPILRVYPMAFARAVVDLIEDMESSCAGQPQLPAVTPSVLETLGMEWHVDADLWSSAGFDELYKYLRGSKRLKIPPEFRPFIPDQI